MSRDLIDDPTSPAYGPFVPRVTARRNLAIGDLREDARGLGLELVTRKLLEDLLRRDKLKTDALNDLYEENRELRRALYRRSFLYRTFGLKL